MAVAVEQPAAAAVAGAAAAAGAGLAVSESLLLSESTPWYCSWRRRCSRRISSRTLAAIISVCGGRAGSAGQSVLHTGSGQRLGHS